MNDTAIETRLRDQLPRLADHAILPEEPAFDLATARVAPDRPRRSPRRRAVLGVAAAIAAVTLVGIVVIDVTSDSSTGDGRVAVQPSLSVVHTITVEAKNFHFDQTVYHAPPGLNEIRLESKEGTHTLAFADPTLTYVHLRANGIVLPVVEEAPTQPRPEERLSAKVLLEPGRTYLIYCELPGHRAAGMEARIVVDRSPSATTTP